MHNSEPLPPPSRLRGFWCLFVTQFQGAFSDNVLKNLVVFMILGANVSLAEEHRSGELVTALFSLPFILFSMAGGFLADRFSKRTIMVGVKIFEVFVMLFVLAGLVGSRMPILLGGVFLMGTHSAFFGPSKYGSLPELLPEKRLSWGNGILELGTFTAIILGTFAAALLSEQFGDHQSWSGLILIALAFIGLAISLGITRVPAADPEKKFHLNFVGDLLGRLRAMRGDRPLILALVGNTYFNFLGALLLLNLFFYGAGALHVSKIQIGFLNVALALGIGLGSVAAGYLSGGKIEYGLVPLGALGLSAASLSLSVEGLSLEAALVRLALLGFAGGFFIVPICALLQHRPDKTKKGEVLAAVNLLSFVGVFLVWPVHYLLAQVAGLTPCQIFLFGGVLTLAGAIYAMILLPDALIRFVLWLLTRTVYRIRVDGRDNIPEKGGALFVCNHVSFVDALLLIASTDRPLRAIMFKGIYDLPFVRPFARIMRAIPISSQLRPREMIKSLREAGDAIRNGEVVVIFAEGQITRIGQLLPFRRGFERIMQDVEAPIIPVCLDNVWGSIFSFEQGRFLWKMPRYLPYPVTVCFGKPLPHTTTPFEVRQAVQDLSADAWRHRRKTLWPLHRAFVRKAQHHRWRFFMADARTPRLNFSAALTRTVFLARRLRNTWLGQERVGILLPPGIPGALVNLAALLLGKVPVNLNYTASDETLASCAQQSSLKTVITARAFLEKVKLTVPAEPVYLEDLAQKPRLSEKLIALAMSWLLPPRALEWALGGRNATLDDVATIIFSSGSTGDPKGVMLTHWNVRSNVEQMGQTFAIRASDRFVGILPFFHSFGFTATLAAPAVLGCGVVYHPSPLDAKVIGELIQTHRCTFLLATPTFLQLYLRICQPEQFGSLACVVTSAEKLPERLAQAFEDKFGIRPLEGYGCTECAPAVAVNTHDFRAAGFRQIGAKRGKIGHPLPGVAVRIVDPDTREPLGAGQPGLLLVRGPNVMQGYLGKPEKTAEVLRDGWYVTGDVAAIDEDGFLQITDRLSRFSKIGGEMVPHIRVEEKLHEFAGVTEQTFVVTSLPDEKKGERLIILHKLPDALLKTCLDKLAQSDLPNLWKPRPDQFFRVEAFPQLGSGKLDLRKVRQVAAALSTGPEISPPAAETPA